MYYTNAVRFTWDPRKAASNARKHCVTFAEAVSVFADPLARIVEDAVHVDRSLIIGRIGVAADSGDRLHGTLGT